MFCRTASELNHTGQQVSDNRPITNAYLFALQHSEGGPIIAVQLENEYGSYENNAGYKDFLMKVLASVLPKLNATLSTCMYVFVQIQHCILR